MESCSGAVKIVMIVRRPELSWQDWGYKRFLTDLFPRQQHLSHNIREHKHQPLLLLPHSSPPPLPYSSPSPPPPLRTVLLSKEHQPGVSFFFKTISLNFLKKKKETTGSAAAVIPKMFFHQMGENIKVCLTCTPGKEGVPGKKGRRQQQYARLGASSFTQRPED